MPNTLAPDDVLAGLKHDASTRTKHSLDIINAICSEHHQSGSRDFSVVVIGPLSSQRGGPSTQAIRNKSGERYRTLLKAWADHTNGATRKLPVMAEPGRAKDLLNMITDASVRAVVGVIIAENRKLKNENTILKSNARVVIDRRPPLPPHEAQQVVQMLPPLSTLLPAEVEALRDAISGEHLSQMGWMVQEKTGRVTKDGRPIFKAGFVAAIKKALEATGSN